MKKMLETMGRDIEVQLDNFLPKPEGRLHYIHEAMRYSSLSGGKRIRPILLLLAYEAVGGANEDVYPFACAVEMIHTYSLIHDDLPAMDDDDFRRGMETNHIKYGEWAAILAGDALLNLAFEIMLDASLKNPKESYIEAMNILAKASGTGGMIGGQVIDIMSEGKETDIETVNFIHRNKTAALMTAPIDMGAVLGGANKEERQALHKFGQHIGRAFQIADDILDVLASEEELGKPVNSDIENNKSTYVTINGIDKAKKELEYLTNEGIKELDVLGESGEKLRKVALFLTSRTY
ncbi:MAG: polyprenyl synthetase family protein [Epulopiscium sp.]|nr:polyprenyl synthetase family protein [Candidatus Epulonipiscium sp.]